MVKKRKRRVKKKTKVTRAPRLVVEIRPELMFYKERIKGFKAKGHGLYMGKCPACGKETLRLFDENPIEVRCSSCRFWTFGADQFDQFLQKIEKEKANAGSQDQSERRGGEVSPETPESQIYQHSGSAEARATGRPNSSRTSTQDEISPEKEETIG